MRRPLVAHVISTPGGVGPCVVSVLIRLVRLVQVRRRKAEEKEAKKAEEKEAKKAATWESRKKRTAEALDGGGDR